jgi:N6-L-threonylcarbamoyladenine synthase
VLRDAGRSWADLDLVAYTAGPGLAGALLVGAGVAAGLAAGIGRPAAPVHHLEGHLLSPFLGPDPPVFPFVALLVSGGHTQLFDVEEVGRYRLLGESIDDAAGEAFDKTAKLLGLGYPGGPALARLAASGDAGRFPLPRPLLHSRDLDFSFSGLKTAVWTQVRRLGEGIGEADRADLAAATQAAIVDVLVVKATRALAATGRRTLVVAGGVGANELLRRRLGHACAAQGVRLCFPPVSLCTDNAAMIALAAAMRWQRGHLATEESGAFAVRPRWPLEQAVGRAA